MSQSSWDVHDGVKLKCEIRDENGALKDPAKLTFKIKPKGGTATVYVYGTDPEIVRESTGKYYVIWTWPSPGQWYYSWRSENPDQYEERRPFIRGGELS